LITAFENRTKRVKRLASSEFEIDGVIYEQMFKVAPNLVPDVILGINFLKENNVAISLTEGRFRTRRYGSNCERKFFYDSLPKNKVGVGLISSPKFQLYLSESQRQPERKYYTCGGAQTTHALMPMQQQNQKELLNTCDEIKFDGGRLLHGNGEAYISDDVSRRHEAVPDNSCTRDDNHFDFTVNMLCNNEVGSGEEDKGTKLCDITGHLPAQMTELKLQTEAVDIRAHSARDLRKKVDVSDNLSHKQMGSLFHVIEIHGSLYVQARLV